MTIIVILSAFCGCLRQDVSDCGRGLILKLVPLNPKHDYPELAQTVSLYLYDVQEELFLHRHYGRDELNEGDGAVPVGNVPPGEYTVVVIINQGPQHRTVDHESLSTLRSYLNEVWIENRLDDFFSGMGKITVNSGYGTTHEKVSIFKHNNDFRVNIIFEGYTVPEGLNLGCLLYGKDGMYHYKSHSSTEEVEVVTLPYFIQYDDFGQPVSFDCSSMRLWRDLELTLFLAEYDHEYNTGETIMLDIPEVLGKITGSDGTLPYDTDEELEYHDQYEITITLGDDFVMLSLEINDWYVVGGDKDI